MFSDDGVRNKDKGQWTKEQGQWNKDHLVSSATSVEAYFTLIVLIKLVF